MNRVCVIVATAVAILVAVPSGAVAAGWTTQPTVDPGGAASALLSDVSCMPGNWCLALGNAGNSDLVESWDGTAWADQSAPAAPAATSSDDALTCLSETFCFAVGGTSRGSTLAERWNGTTWTPVATPNAPGKHSSELWGVSCATSTFCVAVGRWTTGARETFDADDSGGLVETWNGSRWEFQPSPQIGNAGSYLWAVSCSATDACEATGTYSTRDEPFPIGHVLAERWNGRGWSLVRAPDLTWAPELGSVSCVSSSACMAVGTQSPGESDYAQAAAERWNGARWVRATAGLPGTRELTQVHLFSVSCVAASTCTAVGSSDVLSNGREHPIVELWNGRRWSVEATPHTPNFSALSGVSCLLSIGCTAVGNAGSVAPLAESDASSSPSAIA
jgi:hypothetical protein